ncbi:exosome non-catalytic core subunit rrp46 [Orbilia brochopaga]|uniref:Exosome non-catalytic core subunit rrp46 n=1 Tax=Orbilia brochopaga TaxID=3140254 RepID=A0AAV9U311_9PEZI
MNFSVTTSPTSSLQPTMAALPVPDIELSPLPQADGSCQYTCPTSRTTVLTAVNGPIEVRAKDEQPNNATVEVIVKPGIGVGGVRETRLSTILQQTLTSLILTAHHPRTLIQITAQILQSEDHTNLSLLISPLLNCAIFSLLLAGVPLRTTAWSVHLAVLPSDDEQTRDDEMQTDDTSVHSANIVRNPNKAQLSRASSSHVLAFSKEGEMLLIESLDCSEGVGGRSADGQGWDLDEWLSISDEAQKLCCQDGVAVIREVLARQKIF